MAKKRRKRKQKKRSKDRETLIAVLDDFQATMTEILDGDYLPPDLRKPYRKAWKDLEKRGDIDTAKAVLRGKLK